MTRQMWYAWLLLSFFVIQSISRGLQGGLRWCRAKGVDKPIPGMPFCRDEPPGAAENSTPIPSLIIIDEITRKVNEKAPGILKRLLLPKTRKEDIFLRPPSQAEKKWDEFADDTSATPRVEAISDMDTVQLIVGAAFTLIILRSYWKAYRVVRDCLGGIRNLFRRHPRQNTD